jgi:hypothetical protein
MAPISVEGLFLNLLPIHEGDGREGIEAGEGEILTDRKGSL